MVTGAVYPTSQNSTALASSHPTEIVVTAFAGATGGSTPATATIDAGAFVVDTTYTVTLDGVEIVFIPRTADTGDTIASFLAGAVQGDPRLNRKFRASSSGDITTLTAKFGTLTLNTDLLQSHAAPIADPTAAPTLAATASGDLPGGEYRVAYVWKNDRGHTLLSPF
jgi:phage tail sheath gpL-like